MRHYDKRKLARLAPIGQSQISGNLQPVRSGVRDSQHFEWIVQAVVDLANRSSPGIDQVDKHVAVSELGAFDEDNDLREVARCRNETDPSAIERLHNRFPALRF